MMHSLKKMITSKIGYIARAIGQDNIADAAFIKVWNMEHKYWWQDTNA